MKKRTLTYHLVFWLSAYLLWVAIFRNYSFTLTKTMTIEFCYLIFITADFYAINQFTIPRFLNKKKYIHFILFTLGIIALSAWLRALVAVQMNQNFFHVNPAPDFSNLYFNSLVNIFFWVLVITLGNMMLDRTQTQRQLELLEKERVKNELDYLKAQINPHALFNSLNTVYGNIDKSNQVARNILLQFSELLRYQLYECGEEKVNLEKEMTYIKNYISFQRWRKDEKLIVHLEIENIEPGLQIAPLLLVVLIENAFKFVSSFTDKENKICIRIYTKKNVLHSSISNTREPQLTTMNKHSNGIGIINLNRRLQLLYANKHLLLTKNDNDIYETQLTIDLT